MITDEMLAQAADAYVQIMVENIPDLPEYRHSFSARFERRIRRIIHRGSHPVLYKTMRAAGYAVAALVLSFLTLMAVNPSARAAVMDWIRDIYASYYSHNYYNGDENLNFENIQFVIDYLPDGYTNLYSRKTRHNITLYFGNNLDQRMYLSCSLKNTANEVFIEIGAYSVDTVFINGSKGEYFKPTNQDISSLLQWTYEDTNILLSLSGFHGKDDMIKIAKNIKIIFD